MMFRHVSLHGCVSERGYVASVWKTEVNQRTVSRAAASNNISSRGRGLGRTPGFQLGRLRALTESADLNNKVNLVGSCEQLEQRIDLVRPCKLATRRVS